MCFKRANKSWFGLKGMFRSSGQIEEYLSMPVGRVATDGAIGSSRSRARGTIWTGVGRVLNIQASVNLLRKHTYPVFRVILLAQAQSGLVEFYMQLDITQEDTTVHSILEAAGFQLCGPTPNRNVENIGRVNRLKRQIQVIQRLLHLAGEGGNICFLNTKGLKLQKLIRKAQTAPESSGVRASNSNIPVHARVVTLSENALAGHLKRWAETQQLPMHYTRRNRENPEADRVQCGAPRADFAYELEDQRVVLLEHDENEHRYYDMDRELKRQPQMALGYGGRPVRLIRFNPSGGASWTESDRLALLLSRLQAAMSPAPRDDSHFKHFLIIEYLLYSRIEGGGDGPLQRFCFKTVADYERWAVSRTMRMPLLGPPTFSDVDDSDNDEPMEASEQPGVDNISEPPHTHVSPAGTDETRLLDALKEQLLEAKEMLARSEARVREIEALVATRGTEQRPV